MVNIVSTAYRSATGGVPSRGNTGYKITPAMKKEIVERTRNGESRSSIGRIFGVSHTAIRKVLVQMGEYEPRSVGGLKTPVDEIRRLYALGKNVKEIALEVDRSKSVVSKCILRKLKGVKIRDNRKYKWSESAIERARELARLNISAENIARMMPPGYTKWSVRYAHKMYDLGLLWRGQPSSKLPS